MGQSWKDATARVPAQNGLITSKAKNAHMVKQVGRGFGPSERMTVDFSSLDQSTFNIVGGESGQPFSPALSRPLGRLVQQQDVSAGVLRCGRARDENA